ncbi:MAG: amidohydrolase family protein [Acidimicrobiia bacterium]|nr:amidohydrolase family protein [Acidimicrobiia bacterium]
MPHDLVITGGTVVDGTGGATVRADVAVDGDRITAVGPPAAVGEGRRRIDAEGAVVTPGFVDVHTHYDGQATWDGSITPSAWHGVTTVVMGNCGVGFAPVRQSDHNVLVELMEGVEDIPGTALHEGLEWDWETFPEYLDALERRPRDLDVAAQLPHGALRLYVMGERGAAREPATDDEVIEMARLAGEAVDAGALGFTTSRTRNHRTSRGDWTPTLTAAAGELAGIAQGLGAVGKGVLQVVSDFTEPEEEVGTVLGMAEASGRPLSISLSQTSTRPEGWRSLLDAISAACDRGLAVSAQVAARPVGILLGLDATINPLGASPTARSVGADLPTLRRSEVRATILEEMAERSPLFAWDHVFRLGDPPDYEPPPHASIAAEASRCGVPPEELVYDAALADDGRGLLYVPFLNYADGDLEAVRAMLTHPHAVLGLADGGAHVGTICDGSFPTTMLTHWVRDRSRGERLPLAHVVAMQTSRTARLVGLLDRGVIAPGMRADLNVIDMDGLRLRRPTIVHDLPAGGRRFVQRADGYLHTIVAGEETYADGEATGARPGRLARGSQPGPNGSHRSASGSQGSGR